MYMLEHLIDRSSLRYVHLHNRDIELLVVGLLLERLGFRRVSHAGKHVVTLLCEMKSRGKPDAGAGAGDECTHHEYTSDS